MKRLVCVVAACATAILWNQPADAAAEESAGSRKAVVLVNVGPLNKVTMKRVSDFLAADLECPIRVAEERTSIEGSPDAEAKALSSLMTDKDLCVVALLNVPQETKFANAVLASYHVALINVRYPDLPPPLDAAATETCIRRIEEDAMRSVATLLGLPACPFKLCALHYVQSITKKGEVHSRNLCPPCQNKARKVIKGEASPSGAPEK